MAGRPGPLLRVWTLFRARPPHAKMRDMREAETMMPPLPAGPFGLILADPPWSYSAGVPGLGAARGHYATQGQDWLKALPVAEVAAPDAVLVLWATWPHTRNALDLIAAWGFEFKTGASWLKTHDGVRPCVGIGYWVRGSSEPILIATRGKPTRPANPPFGIVDDRVVKLPEQAPLFLTAPRREHSRKPPDVHRLAEALSDDPRRLELFARRPEPGWTCWGNEMPEAG